MRKYVSQQGSLTGKTPKILQDKAVREGISPDAFLNRAPGTPLRLDYSSRNMGLYARSMDTRFRLEESYHRLATSSHRLDSLREDAEAQILNLGSFMSEVEGLLRVQTPSGIRGASRRSYYLDPNDSSFSLWNGNDPTSKEVVEEERPLDLISSIELTKQRILNGMLPLEMTEAPDMYLEPEAGKDFGVRAYFSRKKSLPTEWKFTVCLKTKGITTFTEVFFPGVDLSVLNIIQVAIPRGFSGNPNQITVFPEEFLNIVQKDNGVSVSFKFDSLEEYNLLGTPVVKLYFTFVCLQYSDIELTEKGYVFSGQGTQEVDEYLQLFEFNQREDLNLNGRIFSVYLKRPETYYNSLGISKKVARSKRLTVNSPVKSITVNRERDFRTIQREFLEVTEESGDTYMVPLFSIGNQNSFLEYVEKLSVAKDTGTISSSEIRRSTFPIGSLAFLKVNNQTYDGLVLYSQDNGVTWSSEPGNHNFRNTLIKIPNIDNKAIVTIGYYLPITDRPIKLDTQRNITIQNGVINFNGREIKSIKVISFNELGLFFGGNQYTPFVLDIEVTQ